MSLVSVAEARALVSTGLTDEQLQAVIDRVEAWIIARYGAHYGTGVTITQTLEGGLESLFLQRPFTSLTSVTEDSVLLTAAGYRSWPLQGSLLRLPAGSRWGEVVIVVYTPVDDSLIRKQVIIDLVRLAVERTAMKSESVAGEYSYTTVEWEREAAQLARKLGFYHV